MERTEAQWQKLYANYKKKYEKLNEDILKATDGKHGMYAPQYSYLGYINAYVGIERSREEEVTAGKRKVLNTQRDLINAQRYKYSQDQIRAVKKALVEKELKKLDYNQFKTDSEFKKAKRDIAKQFKVKELRLRVDEAEDIYEAAKAKNRELKAQKYVYYDKDGVRHEEMMFDSKQRAKIIGQTIFGSS